MEKIRIGNNVRIGKGTILGELPLNLEPDGEWMKRKPVEGGLLIGDNVDIGSNTVICLGAEKDTVIEEHSWIGHQCLIGHDARIGAGSIICSGVKILGHVDIGERCYLAPGSIIRNRVKIGKKSFIGLGSLVMKDIPEGVVAYGHPCKIVRQNEAYERSG